MESISSIKQLNLDTISSLHIINHAGYDLSFTPMNIESLNLLTTSSLMSYDFAGVSTNYIIDIPGAINQSTLQGTNALSELSTMQGISTVQGLAATANYQVILDDIINSHDTLLATEEHNKKTFNSLDFSIFKTNLYKWAAQGYPDSFQAYSFPVTTPMIDAGLYMCSDGNPKTIWDWLNLYQQKVNGITLSFSVTQNPYTLNIHVTRKAT